MLSFTERIQHFTSYHYLTTVLGTTADFGGEAVCTSFNLKDWWIVTIPNKLKRSRITLIIWAPKISFDTCKNVIDLLPHSVSAVYDMVHPIYTRDQIKKKKPNF